MPSRVTPYPFAAAPISVEAATVPPEMRVDAQIDDGKTLIRLCLAAAFLLDAIEGSIEVGGFGG